MGNELQRTTSGRYTLGHEIGRGAMGSVVAARDNVLGRTVAMKRLLGEGHSQDDVLRFLREARVTGRVAHKNVIYVYESGVDDNGQPYFTMPYVRGAETLRDVIDHLRARDRDSERRYPIQRRVEVVAEVCRAVQHAHDQGVIHRDVKPANILLGLGGEVLLLDWGLARLRDEATQQRHARPRPPTVAGDPKATEPDCLVGTPVYMAPEQVVHQAVKQSDVFSLSAVLYELLALNHYLGEWESGTFDDLLSKIVRGDREPAPTFLPESLAAIVDRGLSKDLAVRYGSASELADELEAWLRRRTRRRTLAGALGLSALGLGAVSIFAS